MDMCTGNYDITGLAPSKTGSSKGPLAIRFIEKLVGRKHNVLTKQQYLDLSKLKAFAINKMNAIQIWKNISLKEENIEGKEKIASYQYLSLYHHALMVKG